MIKMEIVIGVIGLIFTAIGVIAEIVLNLSSRTPPSFVAESRYSYVSNDEVARIDNEELHIYGNTPATGQLYILTVLALNGINEFDDIVYIPVNGYFSNYLPAQTSRGEVEAWTGKSNRTKFRQLVKSFAKTQPGDITAIRVDAAIRIPLSHDFDTKKYYYLLKSDGQNSTQITEERWKRIAICSSGEFYYDLDSNDIRMLIEKANDCARFRRNRGSP